MKRKPAAVRSIGIDRDERALEAFGCDYPVELVHDCAHSFQASFPFLGPELVYSDPPYLHATRRSSQRYRFEYEADHVALLDLLKGLPCQVWSRATRLRFMTSCWRAGVGWRCR
ncbi:MAG: hypothetical protein OXE86_20405 [Alphaproteobacteria bacterium]|nr:hypothetical protein [Alphaproteobacteria bacterium]